MPTLTIIEQGAKLQKSSRRIIVRKDSETLAIVPLIKVDALHVYGNVQITTQTMHALLHEGIETSLFTMSGKLLGRLVAPASKNNVLRIRQFEKAQQKVALDVAKLLVNAKIENCIEVLRRYHSNHPMDELAQIIRELSKWYPKLQAKNTAANLLGVEGSASMKYFSAYRRCFSKELQFGGRNRQPPRDEVNALLSFCYVLLGNEITGYLNARGFDPYIGFLHAIQYGRPSLALDMLEPFRPAVDNFVLKSANLGIFKKADFESRDGGKFLLPDSMKKFFLHYQRFLNEDNVKDLSIRKTMHKQVDSFAKHILEGSQFEVFNF